MKKYLLMLLPVMLLTLSVQTTSAQNAVEILNKMDNILYAAKDQTSQVRIVLTDRNNKERVREASLWQKGTDKRLFRFTSPASDAGIAFLSLPDDVMYLYMPAFGKERRIATHVKNQAFAGTDFSYDEMESVPYATKYDPKLMSQTADSWIIELTPKPSLKSDYSKIEVKVKKSNNCPETMVSYDKTGNKLKTAEYTFVKEGKYWYPKEVKMTDLKKNHTTSMIINKVTFDSNLSDQLFSVRNLTSF